MLNFSLFYKFRTSFELYIYEDLLMSDFDLNIVKNMLTHYSGLMKAGTRDFGGDFMSASIFKNIDTNKDGELQQDEIDKAKPNLTAYIQEVLEKDDFYANIHFGETYTKGLTKTDDKSDKTKSEQIIENNLKIACDLIMAYTNFPDEELAKYAKKLSEIVANNNLKLTDIDASGVNGRAVKNEQGLDEILIDNHDSIRNLSVGYLVQTLLHELRHTMEKDTLNSKAEEVEAEETARRLAEKITGQITFNESIANFAKGYNGYAEASPGTYSIPQNTGISVWYKPAEVTMTEDNNLIIKSDMQKDLDNMFIEDHVKFGKEKDEDGDAYPVSAECFIKDKDGNIIHKFDYGDYDPQKRSFNYFKVHLEITKLKNKQKPYPFGLS